MLVRLPASPTTPSTQMHDTAKRCSRHLLHRSIFQPQCTIEQHADSAICSNMQLQRSYAVLSSCSASGRSMFSPHSEHVWLVPCSIAGSCLNLAMLLTPLQGKELASHSPAAVSVRCCCADCTYKHGYLMHRHPKVTRFVYVYVLSFRCVLLNHLLPPNIPNKHPRLPHCARTWNTDDGSLLSIGVPPRCALSG